MAYPASRCLPSIRPSGASLCIHLRREKTFAETVIDFNLFSSKY
jgi:hypothetical protein